MPENDAITAERRLCEAKIYEILKKNKIAKPKDAAKKFENAIYKYTERMVEKDAADMNWELPAIKRIYRNKILQMMQNLDRYRKGDVTPDEMVVMTPRELCPERWEVLVKKRQREEDVAKMETGTLTTMYTCSRCKKNECNMLIRQSRSADEGSSTYLTCRHCDHKWRYN